MDNAISYDNYGKYFPPHKKVVLVREQPGLNPINGNIISSHRDTICVAVPILPPVPNPKDKNILKYRVFTDFLDIEIKISANLLNFLSSNTLTLKFTSTLKTCKRKAATNITSKDKSLQAAASA